METILEVKHLSKHYPSFTLDNISFSIHPGEIVGFIGRNGAGKSTTLKSIYNLIHATSGEVCVLNQNFLENEQTLKQEIGFMMGGVDFYGKSKLKKLTKITKMFYQNWEESTYQYYLKEFGLDENKKVNELSEGMKVKYNLAIALSHQAKLFIFDEPTSGLDPVSRDEIIEIFLKLVEDHQKAILFSTHITDDLVHCADRILYLKKGKLIADASLKDFQDNYVYFEGIKENFDESLKEIAISYRFEKQKLEGLVYKKDADKLNPTLKCSKPSIDTIMIFEEREACHD